MQARSGLILSEVFKLKKDTKLLHSSKEIGGHSFLEMFNKCVELGVENAGAMSRIQQASSDYMVPTWIAYTALWPPTLSDTLSHQWSDVAIPYWRYICRLSGEIGVKDTMLEGGFNVGLES